MVIRSRTTRKRFMGCSNFYGGCKASSPLLQKAKLRATKSPCEVCKWPMVIFRYSRNNNGVNNALILIVKVESSLQNRIDICSSIL